MERTTRAQRLLRDCVLRRLLGCSLWAGKAEWLLLAKHPLRTHSDTGSQRPAQS